MVITLFRAMSLRLTAHPRTRAGAKLQTHAPTPLAGPRAKITADHLEPRASTFDGSDFLSQTEHLFATATIFTRPLDTPNPPPQASPMSSSVLPDDQPHHTDLDPFVRSILIFAGVVVFFFTVTCISVGYAHRRERLLSLCFRGERG